MEENKFEVISSKVSNSNSNNKNNSFGKKCVITIF